MVDIRKAVRDKTAEKPRKIKKKLEKTRQASKRQDKPRKAKKTP